MKIGKWHYFTLLILFAGCSGSGENEPVAEGTFETIQQFDGSNAPAQALPSVPDKAKRMTPENGDGNSAKAKAALFENDISSDFLADKQLATSLKSLTDQAQQHEANFQFVEAANVWRRALATIYEEFGNESWQAVNAKLSLGFAEDASRLDSQQVNLLRLVQKKSLEVQRYTTSKDLASAINAADSANQILVELFGEKSAAVGRQLLEIGSLKKDQNSIDEAISIFHRAILILEQNGMKDHPEIEKAHANLAAMYTQKGKFSPAVSNQKAATRIAAKIWGENSVGYAMQANQLGVIFHRAGQSETALKILEASEAIRRIHLGDNSMQVAHSRLNVGIVQQELRQYDQALESYSQVETILTALGKTDDAAVLRCQVNSATIHTLKGEFAKAQALLGTVVHYLESKKGVAPDQLAKYQYRLAITQAKQGKYDLAKPLLEQTLAAQKASLGESDRQTLQTMQAYALLLKQTRQTDAAQKVYQEINRIAAKIDDNSFQR